MEISVGKRKKQRLSISDSLAPVSRKEVRRQLTLASGGRDGGTRDPVSSVTEDFHQIFDSIGQRRARALEEAGAPAQATDRQTEGGVPGQTRPAGPGPRALPGEQTRSAGEEPARQTGAKRVMPESGVPLEKFSELAFRRGTLSASVLGGTGKLMLVSCLKRTAAQTDSDFRDEATLFGTGSQTRNVPGHAPDQMLFSRGYVNSAVGLVVDTLQSARQTVDSLRDMALGTGELRGGVEGSALFRMYPFLDSSREQEMIEAYEVRLCQPMDAQERAVLQNALVHTRALLDRKSSMKEEFINKLNQLSDRAIQALEEFEAPGFAEEIWREVNEPEEPEELPPDGETPPDDKPPQGGEIPPDDEAPQGVETPPDDKPPQGGEAPPDDEAPTDGQQETAAQTESEGPTA